MRAFILFLSLMGATALIGRARSGPESGFLLAGEFRVGGSYLGISLVDIDADRARALNLDEPRGAEVTRVEDESPAEKAGIKPGDVLLTYNGEKILGAQQLGRLVAETPEGRKVRVQLWRDGRAQTLSVTTGTRTARDSETMAQLMRYMPDVRNMPMPDLANPLLMWKISALGIECEPVESQLAEYFGVKRGLLIRSVAKGSPAEKAGLKAGDVVTSIGDRPVASPHDLTGFLRMQRDPGTPTSVVVVREHKQLTLNLTPLGYPQ